MKILNIKYYLGGGLRALSPISQIIRIFDSAPQLPKIKSLFPGYPSSPKPLWEWGGEAGAHPRNHFTTRNKRIIHVTHIIIIFFLIEYREKNGQLHIRYIYFEQIMTVADTVNICAYIPMHQW